MLTRSPSSIALVELARLVKVSGVTLVISPSGVRQLYHVNWIMASKQ